MKVFVHERTREAVESLIARRGGSYIFYGPASTARVEIALEAAREMNCQEPSPDAATCATCRQFEAGSYPDLHLIRPEDKPSISIEQIRILLQSLALSPYYATGTRTVIVDQADLMTIEAQNALLKLIEEPPPRTLVILVAERLQLLLPTVRSRAMTVYFPATAEAIDSVIADNGELGESAARVLSSSRFERLCLAAKLTQIKADLARFGQLLQALVVADIRAARVDAASSALQMEALELFRRQLQAKVSQRVCLERLMLEL